MKKKKSAKINTEKPEAASKKYDTWKIIMTIITMIFIFIMLILNVKTLSDEKNAGLKNNSKVEISNE
jgi:flagellar biogenesis protein FliO